MADKCYGHEPRHHGGTGEQALPDARGVAVPRDRQPQQRRPGERKHTTPPPRPRAQRHGRDGQRNQPRRRKWGEHQTRDRRAAAAAHHAQARVLHCGGRGEEGVRLVERMSDQVQQRKGVEPEAALHNHEAHLRDRGPGEPHLDAHPRQHHQACEQRCSQTDAYQQPARHRRRLKQRREADEHEAAEVDHACMQHRRHRRGRLHHLDQPAVHRQQRGAQHHRKREANRACL